MTDYLGSLQQFSMHTENTLEDLLDSGQRVDIDVSASVTISRPNRLRAERKGELVSQVFYYDGKTLTLYNPDEKVYATEPASETIEGTLDFARESLGFLVPVADLIYSNAYLLLMQGVTTATVVGKTVIGGAACNHLAFSRPDVDFQVWVADGDQPLPCKYVVTDTSTPALISISTVMSDWNVAPAATDASFTFAPPEGAMAITTRSGRGQHRRNPPRNGPAPKVRSGASPKRSGHHSQCRPFGVTGARAAAFRDSVRVHGCLFDLRL